MTLLYRHAGKAVLGINRMTIFERPENDMSPVRLAQ
jgi:hypothetical protein